MSHATHQVHGLTADAVAPDWPPLGQDELVTLLAHYPQLGRLRGIHWHSPRPLSAAAIVDTAAGRVFVKRHHPQVRSVETLTEEHRFAAHLSQRSVPAPAVLHSAAGDTAVALDAWTYEVQALAAGLDVYRDTPSWVPPNLTAHAQSAGAALARLANAAEDYRAPQRRTHLLVARDDLLRSADPVQALYAQLAERPALAAYLSTRDWQDDFARQLLPRHDALQPQLAALPRRWGHNDWHVSNLLWSASDTSAQVTAVLDFGLASSTSELFDLATAIERNAIVWLALEAGDGAAHAHLAVALVDGYRQQRALSSAQVHLLTELLPLVHLDFALSEVEYFAGISGSRRNADIAYDAFLLGHAAWFDSPPGQRLLAAIRKRA